MSSTTTQPAVSSTTDSASISPSNSLGPASPQPTLAIPSTPPLPPDAAAETFGTNGNNGGGGPLGANPVSGSSAALYLYTFLATLVLLLAVSAAIIVRSLVLRRRHRRMMEEAIRNGTWVPATPIIGGHGPFGGGRQRVDLSKKPNMWEAYLGGGLIGGGGWSSAGSIMNEKDGSYGYEPNRRLSLGVQQDWDSIKPFSATYVGPWADDGRPGLSTTATPMAQSPAVVSSAASPVNFTPASVLSPAVTSLNSASPGVGATATGAVTPSTPRSGWFSRFTAFVRGAPPQPNPFQSNNVTLVGSGVSSGTAVAQSNGVLLSPPLGTYVAGGDPASLGVLGPAVGPVETPTIRVTVLIAMPSPYNSALASRLQSQSHPGHTHATHSTHPLDPSIPPLSQARQYTLDEEEQPLPHIEIGVADLPVVLSDNASAGSGAVGRSDGKGKVLSQNSEDDGMDGDGDGDGEVDMTEVGNGVRT